MLQLSVLGGGARHTGGLGGCGGCGGLIGLGGFFGQVRGGDHVEGVQLADILDRLGGGRMVGTGVVDRLVFVRVMNSVAPLPLLMLARLLAALVLVRQQTLQVGHLGGQEGGDEGPPLRRLLLGQPRPHSLVSRPPLSVMSSVELSERGQEEPGHQ